MKMWTMNLGKPTNVPQLNEAMAIDLGSQILGEAVIFIICAVLICAEYSRQANNEEKKEEVAKAELRRLHRRIQDLNQQLVDQTSWIETLQFTVHELGNKTTSWSHVLPVRFNDNQSDETTSVPTKSSNEDIVQSDEPRHSTPSNGAYEDSDDHYFIVTMP